MRWPSFSQFDSSPLPSSGYSLDFSSPTLQVRFCTVEIIVIVAINGFEVSLIYKNIGTKYIIVVLSKYFGKWLFLYLFYQDVN